MRRQRIGTLDGWTCPKCGAEIVSRVGRYGVFYPCSRWPRCDVKWDVGGFSDEKTRRARVEAHVAFDALWHTAAERDALYDRLARLLGLAKRKTHMRYFDEETCRRVIRLCENGKLNDDGDVRRSDRREVPEPGTASKRRSRRDGGSTPTTPRHFVPGHDQFPEKGDG